MLDFLLLAMGAAAFALGRVTAPRMDVWAAYSMGRQHGINHCIRLVMEAVDDDGCAE